MRIQVNYPLNMRHIPWWMTGKSVRSKRHYLSDDEDLGNIFSFRSRLCNYFKSRSRDRSGRGKVFSSVSTVTSMSHPFVTIIMHLINTERVQPSKMPWFSCPTAFTITPSPCSPQFSTTHQSTDNARSLLSCLPKFVYRTTYFTISFT